MTPQRQEEENRTTTLWSRRSAFDFRFALAAGSGPRGKMNKAKWFLKIEFSKKIRIKYRDRFGESEK